MENVKKELRQAYGSYMKNEPDFKPSDMLEWKPGMRNISHEGPFVFHFRSNDGSFMFATLLSDGTFSFVEIDPRRLQRVPAETHQEESARGMSFGLAIEAMKRGHSVARSSWDKGDFIVLYGNGDILYNDRFMWEADHEDMLADDWYIVEKGE